MLPHEASRSLYSRGFRDLSSPGPFERPADARLYCSTRAKLSNYAESLKNSEFTEHLYSRKIWANRDIWIM